MLVSLESKFWDSRLRTCQRLTFLNDKNKENVTEIQMLHQVVQIHKH